MTCQHCRSGHFDIERPCDQCGCANEPIAVVGLTHAVGVTLSGYSILTFVLALGVAFAVGGMYERRLTLDRSFLWLAVAAIAVYAGTIVVHEAIHGLAMRLFGARARYGVSMAGWWMPYAYASAPGFPFTVSQMAIVCLAPLVILTVVSLPVMALVPSMASYAAVVFVGNTASAVGDLWLAHRIIRLVGCPDVRMIDIADKMAIYSADPRALDIIQRTARRERRAFTGPLLVWSTLMVTALLLSMVPLLFLLDWMGLSRADVGPASFALFVFESTQGRGLDSVSVNLLPVLVTGVLLALPITLWWRDRQGRTDDAPGEGRGSPRPAFL